MHSTLGLLADRSALSVHQLGLELKAVSLMTHLMITSVIQ